MNRSHVHERLSSEVVGRLAEAVSPLRAGNGVDLGPLVDEKIFRTSEEHVADTPEKGGWGRREDGA